MYAYLSYIKEGVVLDSEEWRDKGAEVGERERERERESLGNLDKKFNVKIILKTTDKVTVHIRNLKVDQ